MKTVNRITISQRNLVTKLPIKEKGAWVLTLEENSCLNVSPKNGYGMISADITLKEGPFKNEIITLSYTESEIPKVATIYVDINIVGE